MLIEVQKQVPIYGGWRGVINGLVGETVAQGRAYSVSIAPPPFTDEPVEVYLPAAWLKPVDEKRK
ncbi:hypothetical protein IQ265_12740 [Nodosilinea sp. LEGE 06152]|uniref:hypothetical protein n=1 Tax=Nodosilinea sp. LEGE 06152 TaxID=2777966 RepID=UPI001881A633|nr:hypothetical protein [Nodosilinea sp. LEGE 06152]MBE9157686.1 hypothetical protein [Nodosilinea sp. LEGE 06152]